jgi:hypothetical protein
MQPPSIRCSIIVIVDHRVITPAVSHELLEIIKQGVQFKTILIGHSLTPDFQPDLSSCLQINSEDECCAFLKRVLTDKMVLASDVQPISSLAQQD